MKKLVSLLMALMMLLGLASFASAEDLALITDKGTIDDRSFNQGAWEGVLAYAEDHPDVTTKYYRPKDVTTDDYLDSITMAVEEGAKVVVTPGYLFADAIDAAQQMYPEVKFVLLDSEPTNGALENTLSVLYSEEQSGFLAGYAVVKEGYTKLGFMGGMAVPAVVRFGYGYVQGADYAAQEMGLDAVTINYHYTGDFAATPEVQTLAASWYNDGVEVIFGCGGSVGNSVMAAAEASEGKWVVGVDKDQSGDSETVITSATKGLAASVYQAIEAFYADSFPGGETWVLGADRDGIELPMANSRFSVFTQDDYDAIFAKLVSGEIALVKDTDVADAASIETGLTTVTVIE